jgi:dihydropteroate synthase
LWRIEATSKNDKQVIDQGIAFIKQKVSSNDLDSAFAKLNTIRMVMLTSPNRKTTGLTL